MSLNGLDTTEVNVAYQTAVAEAGGWFLLKYISRDEVDLLRAGNGGVVEVRDAISQYEAKSPLYGFVQYRRRKVLLKYVPEGTSRLLQARVTVHFQSITDRFSPHDAVFSVTSPSDLKETAVSAACSLHTASASVSSSNSSLRRRRLQEIAEDGEDSQLMAIAPDASKRTESGDHYLEGAKDLGKSYPEQSAEEKEAEEKRIWRNEREALRSGPVREGHVPTTPTPSLQDYDGSDVTERNPDYLLKTIREPRASSQSARPTARDLYGEYVYKPKVKLGPRPSTETAGRPYTSGGSRHTETRPISTLPAGIKIPARRPMLSRPRSERSTSNSSFTPIPSLPPKIPDLPVLNHIAIDSVITEVPPVTTDQRPVQPATKPSAITPEKQRLMKALQLRKKQLALAATSREKELEAANSPVTEPKGGADGQRNVDDIPFTINQPTTNNIDTTRSEIENDEDSGSPLHASSSPVSVLAPSEGPSTQASSFTDDNDHATTEAEEKTPDIITSSSEVDSAGPSVAIGVLDSGNLEHPLPSGQPLAQRSPSDIPLPPATDEEDHALRQDDLAPASLISTASLHAFVGNLESAVNHVTNVIQNIGGDTSDTRPLTAETPERQSPQRPNQRRGRINSNRTIPSAENSDDNYLSDDSFMEELKSATVQEAKPVSVAKSPITSMFPRTFQDRRPSDGGSAYRSISNPQQNGALAHAASSSAEDILAHGYSRSFSASSIDLARPQESSGLMARKVNVSSGISRRIKALELVSSRETSPVTQSPLPTALSTSSPSFAEFRKASLPKPNARSIPAGKSETRRLNNVPYPSPSPSPDTLASRKHPSSASSNSRPHTKQARSHEKSQPGSISVTARILRGSHNEQPTVPTDASEPVSQDLYQSPITIEHQGTISTASSYQSRKGSDTPSSPGTRSDKAASASASKHDGAAGGNSPFSRHRNEIIPTNGHTTIEERGEEKKESRRSRILKRMSSISSSSRRSLIQALSPTKEQETFAKGESIVESVPAVVDIGDVNVQFPDTLLWKRRHLMVDDQGYLILSLTKVDANSRSTVKRYHLSEFRIPYMPDHDRQELPNSVLLDFCDGTTLQLACENISGQTKVLRTLKDAHAAYQQLYGQTSP